MSLNKGLLKPILGIALVTLLLLCFIFYTNLETTSTPFYTRTRMPFVEKPVLNTAREDGNSTYNTIFYNRVPKTGSSSLVDVFRKLGEQNKFHYTHSNICGHPKIEPPAIREFVNSLVSLPKPSMIDRHLFHIDFERFGLKGPIYINMIRNPLDRLVSHYYFRRHGSLVAKRGLSDSEFRRIYENITFDECVERRLNECVADTWASWPRTTWLQIPFFCGQDPVCFDSHEKALEIAKQNVENGYMLVGLTEDIPAFLTLLEHMMPSFFRNANSVYTNLKTKVKNKTSFKKPPSPQTTKFMEELLKLDFEFYYFVKQKFYEKLQSYYADKKAEE